MISLPLQEIDRRLQTLRRAERKLLEMRDRSVRVTAWRQSLGIIPPEVRRDVEAFYVRACEVFGVSMEALRSTRRPRHLAEARMTVAFCARERGHGLEAIAGAMGCHHTHVLYSHRKISAIIGVDSRLADRVKRMGEAK